MKPLLILLAALAVTAPAYAQQRRPRLYGNLAGLDYCRMRSVGVPHDQALRAAVLENLADYETEPVLQTPDGQTTKGAADMIMFIVKVCPEMFFNNRQGVEL